MAKDIFADLPRCIVCGHPILKDAPSVQFSNGVACNRKRSKQRLTCAERASRGCRWLKGLDAPGAFMRADRAREELETNGPQPPAKIDTSFETGDLFADYDPAKADRNKWLYEGGTDG